MHFTIKLVAACASVALASAAFAQKGETVKIAMIEGLSGPMGNSSRAGNTWPRS